MLLAALVFSAAEFEFKLIYKYIEFLVSPIGKGLFLLIIGVLMFDVTRKVDIIASICISLVGMSNLIASSFTKEPEPVEKPAVLEFPEDSEFEPLLPPSINSSFIDTQMSEMCEQGQQESD